MKSPDEKALHNAMWCSYVYQGGSSNLSSLIGSGTALSSLGESIQTTQDVLGDSTATVNVGLEAAIGVFEEVHELLGRLT